MKKILFIVILATFYTTIRSQTTDSLKTTVTDSINLYIINYEYQKALQLIDKQEPSRELLLRKSSCYKALNNYNQSCQTLIRLSIEYPNDKYILSELASAYQTLNNWNSAMECYDNLITIDSTNAYFKIKKADMLFNQDKYVEAKNLYSSIYQNYNMPSVLKQLGRCYENMKITDSAQIAYKKAWEYDFTDTQALSGYANTCFKTGEFHLAINACETYIEKDSTNKQINCLQALGYYVNDDYETASQLFAKCREKGDSSLIVNRSLGMCYYLLKDSMANKYLDLAFAQDTTNNNVLYCLAITCNDLSKPEQAITYFTKLLDRVIPKQSALYLNYRGLAIAYNENREYNESIKNYLKAMECGTENQKGMLSSTIADIYNYSLDDMENALKYYRKYAEFLNNYTEKLKAKENQDSTVIADIKDAEARLIGLNSYIKSLIDKTKPQQQKATSIKTGQDSIAENKRIITLNIEFIK